jgi:hypothetical protein
VVNEEVFGSRFFVLKVHIFETGRSHEEEISFINKLTTVCVILLR